jgi:MoaA/NifB/PqqE/SkfB family radical SAM enzyme
MSMHAAATSPVLKSPGHYYRLPWSLTDNGISWLEVTTSCNLECKGCYRPQTDGHKSLSEIADDVAVFKRERTSDAMSIAGGDPLVHPKIVDIVRMVREGGWKPVVNTNGLAMSRKLLAKLKDAGVFGFTFHIDTSQVRRDSPSDTEEGHNALRQKLAEMVAEAGGMSCAFNQTVSADTLDQVPAVVRWARERPDIVHTVVFILYREPELLGDFDYFANGNRVDLNTDYEKSESFRGARKLTARDVVAKIREAEPDYEPCAYLNGHQDPESFKWLLGIRVASGARTHGFVTPRFMEVTQGGSHLFRGKWLSYCGPRTLAGGRAAMLGSSLVDSGMRKVAGRWAKSVLRQPSSAAAKAHLQTFTIIQPIDALPDGTLNMCDGCPDMTVYKGRMYWSCRLEEIRKYGCFVTAAPRSPCSPRAEEASPVLA